MDTLIDIVIHDAYCDLQSLYLCSHSSQTGLGWNWLLDRTYNSIIIRNQRGKKKCMSSHWLPYHAKWRITNWIPCLIYLLYMMHILTYKLYTTARIPVRQVLVETGCFIEHKTLLSFEIKMERNALVLINCHTMRNEG